MIDSRKLMSCTLELLQEEVLQEVQPMLDISKEDLIEQIIKILFYMSSGSEICKIFDLEAVGKKHEDFLIKYKNSEGSYYDGKLKAENEKMDEIAEKDQTMCKFETVCTEQKKNICKLNDCYSDLLGKMDTEMAKKDEQFKMGRTERKKRQESFKRFVERLQELRLIGLGTFLNELLEVKSVSFDSMKHTKGLVAECLSELQDVKAFLELEWHLKRKLEKEKQDLELKLRYQQGIIMDLEDEAGRRVVELAQKEKQLKVLEMMVAESKRNLKEKEREILDKDEEKREAIRQLCLLNEHYRENYNYLTRHVSSMLQSKRPS
ncbi:hypothetical protein HPP92_024118 [Vanilla planifolia]|uniref:Uncharacterized protein n=1 Tax=Vanilla planifolia TaxID=51239 RepID=A0A835PPP7_VANPL|nr:hypothetical protein HPP92_024118 [Vanilla planifolia]